MNRISGLAHGEAKSGGTPTVEMVLGTGNLTEDGRFCLTNECCSEQEVENAAVALIDEIHEWCRWGKAELRNRSKI